MSPPFRHTIHRLPHRHFDELFSVTPIPAELSVFSGLTFQTLRQGTNHWHYGGSTLCQSGRVRMGRLVRRSSKRSLGERALFNLFNLVLSWGVVPTLWSARLQTERRRSRRAASNSWSIWSISALDRSSLPNSMSAREDSDGVLMFLVSSFLEVLSSRRSALTFVAFVDTQKAFDTAWVEGTLVRLHDVGADVATHVPLPP